MAVMTDLAVELLEMIFHYLGSIDDVHHFGRTCKKLAGIIQRPTVYTKIMRSIIFRAPQHRYDIQLYWLIKFHANIVWELERTEANLPTTQAGAFGYDFNEWEKYLSYITAPPDCNDIICDHCLSDAMVFDILARYQGLRVLEDLWLERQLGDGDYVSADGAVTPQGLTKAYHHLISRYQSFQDGDILPRVRPEAVYYTAFNADQRARFHAAVACVWLLNEVRWVLTSFVYPVPFDVQIRLLEICKTHIVGVRREPLLDELDQHAMFKFIYHHLLPLYGSDLGDGKLRNLPFTFSLDFTKDLGHCSRLLQLFLTAGQTYVQPGDIIDLIARVQASRKYPYPVVKFPATTLQWQRPSTLFSFSIAFGACNLWDLRLRGAIARRSLNHLNLITRSSIHQSLSEPSRPIHRPVDGQMYRLKDLSHYYFLDRALVAFELYEKKGADLRDIREVFAKKWGDELWSVWWWANSEGKARAKMERWRREPVVAGAQRRVY